MRDAARWVTDFLLKRSFHRTSGGADYDGVDIFDAALIDSFGLVELIAAIESRFGFEVTAEHLDDPRFRTIRGIAELIDEHSRPGRIQETLEMNATSQGSNTATAPVAGYLTPEQLEHWRKYDFLGLPTWFSHEAVEQMLRWVEEIERWPIAENRHFNYYEIVDGARRLSRTENFLPYHPDFRDFLAKSGVFEIACEILGEQVVLFKEKINYKFPGTGDYPPHQDVHAYDTSPYAFQPYHLNVAIFLDSADEANGCLELGWGYEKNTVLDRHPNGALLEEVIARLDWRPLPCPAGSLFIFNMFWPHRSGINLSSRPRRTIFLTFNGVSKGDLREAHYRDRASSRPNSREIKANLVSQTRLVGQQRMSPARRLR